jgi:hypothetical protein
MKNLCEIFNEASEWQKPAVDYIDNSLTQTIIFNFLHRALKTPRIIEAFSILPRAEFLLPDMLDEAYNDHPLRFATMGFNIRYSLPSESYEHFTLNSWEQE